MSVSSVYNEQLQGGGDRIEGMDIVADAIWKAANHETGLSGPYFFAMYGETPDQRTAAGIHEAVEDIDAPLGEPLLILRPDHKFVPRIITKAEGVRGDTGVAYTVNRDGRMRGTGKWIGMVGVHSYHFNKAGALVAGVHPLIHSERPVGTANARTDLRPDNYSLHVGQAAIESAIFDAIAQVNNPKRSAEQVLETFNSQATLLRKTVRQTRTRNIRHQ